MSDEADGADGSDGSEGEVHPCRGATALFHERLYRRDPDRGPFCIARVSRHEVPKTPGFLRYALIYTTPSGCRSLRELAITTDPWRGRGEESCRIPGVVGATPLRHPGYEQRAPTGVPRWPIPEGALSCRTGRTANTNLPALSIPASDRMPAP